MTVRWTPVKKLEPGCGCRLERSLERVPSRFVRVLSCGNPAHPLGPALPPVPPAPTPAGGSRRLVPRATKRPPR